MEILSAVVGVTVIAVGLACIIVMAEKYLNNYGECILDINEEEKSLKVTGGGMLLSTLAENKIFIPSACGGKATCGLCKLEVKDGAGPLLPTEEPYLSADELKKGVRLCCQVKVKKDMKLFIPEELFNIKEFKTVVEKIEDLTHDIKGVRFKLMDPDFIKFKAGQYVQIHTKPYGKVKEKVFRAYSIASNPSDSGHLEMIVRLVPGGIATSYVHNHLLEGQEVTLSGPYGDFYLRGNCEELVFVAGGSGLAPIRSLVLDILERQIQKRMTFFFGAVSAKDLYYLEEFREIERQHSHFKFVPALSKPEPQDNWTGETGLITEVLDRMIPDAVRKESYLCGSPGMINACIKVLENKGFHEETIFYDKFS
jgi:Na+-transporting NADH:ubiquinone oxidoreductase subunit F